MMDGDDPSLGYLSSDDEEDPQDDPFYDGAIEDDTTGWPSFEIGEEIDARVKQPARSPCRRKRPQGDSECPTDCICTELPLPPYCMLY